jgi:hypothetical protein
MSRDPIEPLDEFTNKTAQTANQAMNDAKDRVSDMTSKVKDKAGQVAESVSEKLGHQRQSAADSLGRAASALHDTAESMPGGPKVVGATHSIADGLGSTASYLRDRDFTQMGKDVMDVCRRYPTQSVVAALAIGFLIGRSKR